jgi:hypothetical protein
LIKLHKKSKGDSYHFVIFERETEEESVLTISKLLLAVNVRVTLFLSAKIFNLIENEIKLLNLAINIVDSNLNNSINQINEFIEKNPIDLVLFTRFSAKSYNELLILKKFIKKHQVCSLIESYNRWFSLLPPIEFNGWNIIKRHKILDWIFCKLAFNHFSGYFVSDIHVNSDNPLKQILQKRTQKPILDFPFKIMESEYNPSKEYNTPCFVIPGAIERNRRDYFLVLNILTSKQLISKNWKLILLGRPIDVYGEKVISFCQKVNNRLVKEKIIFFDQYISKELFDHFMELSNFIIAPINPRGYKNGKDSGALYDVFHYNKFGIFNNKYFYYSTLPEIKCLLTYNNENDLRELLTLILNKKFDSTNIFKNLYEINRLFAKDNYAQSLMIKINDVIRKPSVKYILS